MKFLTRVVLCFSMVVACGDGGKREPFDCTLTDAGVVFENAALHVEISVVVTDQKGQAIEGVVVSLQSDRVDDAIEPEEETTKAAGQAIFSVQTTKGGTATFQAQLVDEGKSLGSPYQVPFELDLELSAGDVELTHPGGRVSLTGSVRDSRDPVVGAVLVVSSSRGDSDTIDPASQASAADGTAVFEVTTMESGLATFTIGVDGLDLTELGEVDVHFNASMLTGEWGFPQPEGVIAAPRIGLVWIDYAAFETGSLEYRELFSAAIAPVPDVGVQGTYSLPLPLQAPREDLYDPAPEDTTLPDNFVIAPYAMVIYDDLDASADFTAGDPVVALSDEDVLLVYAEGDLPTGVPNITGGYQFMEMEREEQEGIPTIVPLSDLIDKNDLYIRSAPCPSGPISGQVAFGNHYPPGTDTRVAVMLVDANLIFQGRENEIYESGNYVELVSDGVSFAQGSSVEYELTLPDPAIVDPGYQSFLVTQLPRFPAFGIVTPVVYVDVDGDDAHTDVDQIIGAWDLPFGYGALLMEWIDGPVSLIYSIMIPGINPGYNIIREPLKIAVHSVVDDNTLRLVETVPADHTDLCFSIIRETVTGEILVIEGSDLATGDVLGFSVTSATGGFSGVVQPGDELVFCNRIDAVQVLDLDMPYNLMTL